MKKFFLRPAILAAPAPLHVTKREFVMLARAREELVAAFAFEENFDLLLSNYVELEVCALNIAAGNMVRHFGGYSEGFDHRSTLNRRVVNLLTSARLYVDQLSKRVSPFGLDEHWIRQLIGQKYDSDFEFRFMEALRNHVQHHGSAVHGVSGQSKWLPPHERKRDEYTVCAYALKAELSRDGGFKKSVLAETPERVDVVHATRIYMESIGGVHVAVRKSIDEKVAAARDITQSAIARYKKSKKVSTVGLAAFEADDGQVVRQVPIFLDWDDVRVSLSRKNGSLANLRKRLVSSVHVDS